MTNIKRKQTIKQKILNSPTKLIENCENSLAALWRTILKDLDIDEKKWDLLMNMYLIDPVNGFDSDTKILGDKRGNLAKALCYNRMQMLIFNRALRFLRTQKATFIITLYPEDKDIFPISTYDINILYGKSEVVQKSEALSEDRIAKPVVRRQFVNSYQKVNHDVSIKKYSGDCTLEEWLKDPTKMTSAATGPLSKLWRRILTDRNVNEPLWKTLTLKYQRKVAPSCDVLTGKETKAQLKAKAKQRSNIRGNVTDELRRTAFTIDVLMKGMVFLEIEKVDITIRLKRDNHDRLTEHSIKGWSPLRDLDKIIEKYNE